MLKMQTSYGDTLKFDVLRGEEKLTFDITPVK